MQSAHMSMNSVVAKSFNNMNTFGKLLHSLSACDNSCGLSSVGTDIFHLCNSSSMNIWIG